MKLLQVTSNLQKVEGVRRGSWNVKRVGIERYGGLNYAI